MAAAGDLGESVRSGSLGRGEMTKTLVTAGVAKRGRSLEGMRRVKKRTKSQRKEAKNREREGVRA